MDGIISGKIEKLAGTLEFKASIHVDMVEGHVSLQAESTTDGVSHYNPTDEAGYDASNKKYYIDFQYQSPMRAGYNFVVALSPYIAVLQVS